MSHESLPLRVKSGYALGDHTINVQLASVSLFFLFFLTEVAGLSPTAAGLVLLLGRAVDAFTDPLMGRVSDAMRWKLGRRRPFFLIGAIPFGVTFALLWSDPGLQGEHAIFMFYASVYVLNTLCSTLLAVPYVALLPELALGYDERTSMNTFRSVAVMAAILLTAVGMPALVRAFGGGAAGYERSGMLFGFWIALPWLIVFAVTWERSDFRRPIQQGFAAGVRGLAGHRTYRILSSLFLSARIAVDVSSAMLLFYFTHWLGRPEDFPLAMGAMLGSVILSLPVWLRLARTKDKRSIFIAGALWWSVGSIGILLCQPEHPRWLVLALFAFCGVGYAVADLIPWSMLGDVIDEGELVTGQRQEGIYGGVFTFLRKLGGALGVAGAGFLLDWAGFLRGGGAQGESALLAIRSLASIGPIVFLLLASWIALHYPLTRERHAQILTALARERENHAGG
ncbi:MAG: MFS transporter [Deltaproteobacteria bacterium]|nr:MFS transporter [Deltaproteobacteria bacterium]MBW2393692.1 MFS transporter [Deltaproteobacteria bacterium]